MPLLIFFLIILLPAAEVYLLFGWFGDAPISALLYFITATLAGFLFIFLAKAGIRDVLPRLRDINRHGLRAVLVFAKLWVIGALLLFPGYITDCIALYVLLFVGKGGGKGDKRGGGGDDIMEVKARLIKDE